MRKNKPTRELYSNRKLSNGYPELAKLEADHYMRSQIADSRIPELMRYIERLVDVSELTRNIAVIGCGPNPHAVRELLDKSYNAIGIEPIAAFVESASEYPDCHDRIYQGCAEEMPLRDRSQSVVFMETVLEHVDSPIKSVSEAYRVLEPGGVLYVRTVNRYRISWKGFNPEYNVRFFHWLPDIIKESFVHQHLHFNPTLANYTQRPAVHWYTFSDLCKLGRQAGFHRFYSILDVSQKDDPTISKSRLRRFLLEKIRDNPWLRSIALAQFGDSIFMIKRKNL